MPRDCFHCRGPPTDGNCLFNAVHQTTLRAGNRLLPPDVVRLEIFTHITKHQAGHQRQWNGFNHLDIETRRRWTTAHWSRLGGTWRLERVAGGRCGGASDCKWMDPLDGPNTLTHIERAWAAEDRLLNAADIRMLEMIRGRGVRDHDMIGYSLACGRNCRVASKDEAVINTEHIEQIWPMEAWTRLGRDSVTWRRR